MSHGPSSSSDTVEPNLTPLLDLVLQLLMLFMICGNFASESNDPVDLARSTTAKRLSDDTSTQTDTNKEDDFLFLTVKPYASADGVRQQANDEITNREVMGTNPDPNVAKGGFTHELAAHYRKILESDPDCIYNRLKNHELLNQEQADLLKMLSVPVDSEHDLGGRFADDIRDRKLAKFQDGDSYVIVPGTAMKPDDDLRKWLKDQHDFLVSKHGDDVKTVVVIRPDANIDYAVVYQVLLLCQEAHFTNLKVRAVVPTVH
ncbi:MAG TPA: biopolymer transporter ExbD [Gemmataceae bacterium]|nr:biopolymer transporter ExbD [Gemmataceae bacterium]